MKRTLCLLLCLILMAGMFTLCASADSSGPAVSSKRLEELDGKKIGVLTGSIHDSYAKNYLPNAKIEYFSSVSDMVAAVQNGTIDGFSNDILSAYALLNQNDKVAYIDYVLDYIPTAFAFPKTEQGAAQREEMNAFLAKLEADGTLQQLQEKWLQYDSGDYALDLSDLRGHEKTLVFATACSGRPNAYYYNGVPPSWV